jgi:hypothetical protein
MDPIRVGQFSLGGTQRLQGNQPAAPAATPEQSSAPSPAATVAGGVNELRSIGSRIAEIERVSFLSMARRDRLDELALAVTNASPDAPLENLTADLASLEQDFGSSADADAPSNIDSLKVRVEALRAIDDAATRARTETLAQLVAQMRGAVGAQTGAASADFSAAGAAAALRAGLLGQPAPTPPPPSGGIEPKRSVELLTDRDSTP